MLVDRSAQVPPNTGDFHICFVDEPATAHTVTARPGRFDEQGSEALYPPVDGDVVDVDAAFGEEFFYVAV